MNGDNLMWLMDVLAGEVRQLRMQMENMQKNHQHVRENVLLEAKKAGAKKEVLEAIEALWSGK